MPYVEDIKNETPAFYDITYEDAFKNFFSWPRWSSFKADDGTWVVEFSGKCQYDDKTAKAVIQFLPEEANHGTFAVYVITINDSAEDTITAYAILNTIFETAEADGIQSASSSASKSSGFGSSASPVTETLSDYEEITVIGTIESDSNGYPYLFFEQPVQYIVDGQNYGVYDSIFLFLAENSSSNYRNGDVVTVRGRIFDYRGGGTLYLDNATIQ